MNDPDSIKFCENLKKYNKLKPEVTIQYEQWKEYPYSVHYAPIITDEEVDNYLQPFFEKSIEKTVENNYLESAETKKYTDYLKHLDDKEPTTGNNP